MTRTLLIEVVLEGGDRIDSDYSFNPEMSYELEPTHPDLDGTIEFVCRKSDLAGFLNRIERRGSTSSGRSTSKAIYAEPDEEVGEVLKEAADTVLGGFGNPAIDAIIESIQESIMPNTVRNKRKRERED